MGSWFYSTEYVLQNRPVRISGIVHAEDEIAAYKRAQFAVEVYEKGVLVEVCDMPKYKADALCKRLTEKTGLLHDWHYFGGRVVIKRLNK